MTIRIKNFFVISINEHKNEINLTLTYLKFGLDKQLGQISQSFPSLCD